MRVAGVAKLVILGALLWTLLIIPLRVVLVAKLLISDILSSVSFVIGLYTSYRTLIHNLVYLNKQEKGLNC